jgi:uncharacterized membrane protein
LRRSLAWQIAGRRSAQTFTQSIIDAINRADSNCRLDPQRPRRHTVIKATAFLFRHSCFAILVSPFVGFTKENRMQRDVAKTASFAAVHFSVAFGIAYALTGSVAIATGIGLIEPIANTVAFYFHERIWRNIDARRANTAPAPGLLYCRH